MRYAIVGLIFFTYLSTAAAIDYSPYLLISGSGIHYAGKKYTYLDVLEHSQAKSVTIAFIIGKNCQPKLATHDVPGFWLQNFKAIKKTHQVGLSFGGQLGESLAATCQSSKQLYQRYKNIALSYEPDFFDLDIERGQAKDKHVLQRQFYALKRLQDEINLRIRVTLDTKRGLIAPEVLRELKNAGLKFDLNLMVMNFSKKPVIEEIKQRVRQVELQYLSVFTEQTATDFYQQLTLTPWAGNNQRHTIGFYKEDAAALYQFAQEHGCNLSLWSLANDLHYDMYFSHLFAPANRPGEQ